MFVGLACEGDDHASPGAHGVEHRTYPTYPRFAYDEGVSRVKIQEAILRTAATVAAYEYNYGISIGDINQIHMHINKPIPLACRT